ncbi:hypothetical protein COPCOM_02777 [Coprococcus comes ATCC 27758]|uniref:MATE domain protein n=1 Tax=Coprococcus comes ATCC 27758 TaxID=470146 RepID=C0BC86_9FIRM|nr:hypothetical protein COPCOM_02777 [Coprococcus comes ATCC 27758]
MNLQMKRVDFENGTITSNILGASLPMLVAQILSLLYNIVDRIYIARIPHIGTAALGAVGLCFPVIVIITAFSNLFGSGGAPLFSIERGKNEPQEAKKIMNISFFHGLYLCHCTHGNWLFICPPDPGTVWCLKRRSDLCISVPDALPDRNSAFYDCNRYEPVYQCTGIFNHRHAFSYHRGSNEPAA